MRKFIVFPVVLLLCGAIIFGGAYKESYVFTHAETGDIAAYLPVGQPEFRFLYTHSIHLSDVVEHFRVQPDGTLLLTELEYEDFAIGMPSDAGEGEVFVEENGTYRITNMNREFPDFRLLVGDVDADLILIADGQKYDLKKVLERGETYKFDVQKLTLYDQLKGVRLNEQ